MGWWADLQAALLVVPEASSASSSSCSGQQAGQQAGQRAGQGPADCSITSSSVQHARGLQHGEGFSSSKAKAPCGLACLLCFQSRFRRVLPLFLIQTYLAVFGEI